MNDALLNIAVKAARGAGDAIRQAFDRIDRIKVEEKGPRDLVTNIDIYAEQIIIETIHSAYPAHSILAEESGEQHNGEVNDKTVQWIIDPIDGTNNFAHGFPHFAISIAVRQGDKITHGVIYDPLRDELFCAIRGSGATLNDRKIRVTDRQNLHAALLGTGFPFRDTALLPKYLRTFEPLAAHCTGIRRAGSAALDLAYVASGRLDGFWEFGLNLWDIAAGCLLVTEAGGMISDIDGSHNQFKTGNVIAANRKMFKELLQVINTAL